MIIRQLARFKIPDLSTLNEIRFGQGDNVTEAMLYCLCDIQDVAAISCPKG